MTDPAATRFSATVFGRVEAGILLVTIDHPPVNATSQDVRAGLIAAIRHANSAGTGVSAVVLTGAGTTFIGGADIREFGQPVTEPTLPDVIDAIEASDRPVVAALNGAALGGGLEVALACHHRIAVPSARLGLPDVKLGIVPGAGGTQRLPRLIGIPASIDIIATGRMVPASEAQTLGIIDALAEAADLSAAAIAAARQSAEASPRRTGTLAVPSATPGAIDTAATRALARSRGQRAPAEAVRLVRLSADLPLAAGLTAERETFLELRGSPEAAALRHVFFAERAAAKVDGLDGITAIPVATIGVVGLGLMGSGIAMAALDGGYKVIGVEQSEAAAEAGRSRLVGLMDRSLKSGRLTDAGKADRLGRLTIAGSLDALAEVDLVIEAVFDDMEVKSTLFRALSAIVRPDTILGTNTSYLDPDRLADAATHPERVVGLHFFSPANVMRLAEIVRCARTAPAVLATGLTVARKLGKLPIVTGVTEGFIGNRVFSAYRREAEFLIEDGASPEAVDRAMEDYGFAMGPFAVFDLAGLEIAWAKRKRLAATRNPADRYVDIPDRLCEAGRFGQKTGRGWYDYSSGSRRPDPDVAELIAAARAAKGLVPRDLPATEIVTRLLSAMATEGEALLSEGIAARSSDIDLVMINGYGFPAHKGGPMFAATAGGLE